MPCFGDRPTPPGARRPLLKRAGGVLSTERSLRRLRTREDYRDTFLGRGLSKRGQFSFAIDTHARVWSVSSNVRFPERTKDVYLRSGAKEVSRSATTVVFADGSETRAWTNQGVRSFD